MTFTEYQQQCKRTCPDLGGDKFNLPHMVLGMNSEMNELTSAIENEDKINIIEEICDFQWYFANYCTFRGYHFIVFESIYRIEHETFRTRFYTSGLYHELSKLQDLVKKNMAYGKEINPTEESTLLSRLQLLLAGLAQEMEIDIFKGLENNINKLKIRFPDKFDETLAINRDHTKERVELEK